MSIREELEFDITEALSRIDSVGDALDRVAAAFRRDLSRASSELNIDDTVTVRATVDADASDVTASIDAAVQNADKTVEVNGETRNLTQEVQGALDAANSNVTVTGDATSVTGTINAAVDAADTQIEITANVGGEILAETAGAAASIDAVGESADNAGVAVEGLGNRGSASLGKLAAAAVAIVGVVGVLDLLNQSVESATNLAESQSKVGAVFGESADQIDRFAESSAESLGLANQQALEFAGTFGNLFTSMGLSREEAAKLSPQVVQLGSDLASFNNIGVPDALEKLRSGLVGEIEPLRALGVSFSAVDVEAKAMELGLAGANGEVSEGAKVQARWALILERTTNAQGDFARTSDGLANQMRILQGEIGNASAEAGEEFLPTLLELIDTARGLIPAVAPLAQVFSTILLALAPSVDTIANVLVPLLALGGDAITRVFEFAVPVLEDVSDIIQSLLGPAIEGIGPEVDNFVEAIGGLLEAGQPLVDVASDLAQILGPVLAAALTLFVESGTNTIRILAGLLGAIEPLLEAASPLVTVARAFGLIDESAGKAAVTTEQFSAVSTNIIDDATALAEALAEDDANFKSFIATGSEFAAAGSVVLNQLRRTGISLEDLQKQLGNGEQGFKDFVSAAVDAGQIDIEVDGVRQTGDDIRNLDGSLTAFLNTQGTAVTRGGELTSAFIAQTNATREQARSQFEAIAAAQGLTDQQIADIGVRAQQTFGVDNYITRLQILAAEQTAQADQQAAEAARLQGNAAAWVALTQATADGTIQTGNAAAAAALLGVDVDTASAALANAQTAVDGFVANALDKFPTVTTVFNDLKNATNPVDPLSLTNNLNAATLASLTFQQNIDTIAQRFPEVAKVLQEQGPIAAGAFAQTFLASSDEIKQGLEDSIVANKSTLDTIGKDILASIGTNTATATELAKSMTGALDADLKFDEVTQTNIDDARKILEDEAVIGPLKEDANQAGKDVGSLLSAGLALGLSEGVPAIEQAARDAITRAEEAARNEAQSESPSKLFAALGQDLGDGVAVGLANAQAGVVAEAERIVRAAAESVAGQSLDVPVSSQLTSQSLAPVASSATSAGGTSVTNQFGDIVVPFTPVPGMSDAEARSQGRAFGVGIVDAIETEARIS